MFSRELNNANTVKRMADFLGHHLRIMKKVILILAAMLTFAACTKEGNVTIMPGITIGNNVVIAAVLSLLTI